MGTLASRIGGMFANIIMAAKHGRIDGWWKLTFH
jgi:hypothetical protein